MKVKKIIILFLAIVFICPVISGYSDKIEYPPIPGKRFLIYHFNDIHGALGGGSAWWMNPDFPPPLSGALGAAGVIKRAKKWANENNVYMMVVDSGDWFQGTIIGNYSYGIAVADFFKLIGVEVTTLGNHDFDFGQDKVIKFINYGKPDFKTISDNIVYKENGKPVDYVIPYYIKDFDGIKIGFFGIITPSLRWVTMLENVKNIETKHIIEVSKKAVKALKAKGVDIICALTHIGIEDDKFLMAAVPEIDIIFGGHSHTGTRNGYIDPYHHTYYVQNFGSLSCMQEVRFIVDEKTKKIQWISSRMIDLFAEKYPPDPEAVALYNKNLKKYAADIMNKVVGYAAVDFERSPRYASGPQGNLTADVMREITGADVAFFSGERDHLSAGVITYADLFSIFPFGNTIVTMTLTGDQLWYVCEYSVNGYHAAYQVSGLKMIFDLTKPRFRRVKAVFVNGKPLDRKKVYKIATTNYLAQRSCFIPARNIVNTGIKVRDAVAEYIKKHSPIYPDYEARIINMPE